MELLGATASHVGNVRESNQDRAHFGGYLAVVADGMGGHQGGEMAASIAISEFIDVNDPVGPGGLVELVEEANRAVFERAADPDLRGMGTTLVALTLRPSEEKVSIVNVGDSRAYHLRGSEFGQLTRDHSLVEDLVRQKRLTPAEALTHPQRNILTRALGIASEVEVDRFLVPTKIGDRFLLCSDGLFNEVSEEDIVRILTECAEPNDAADQLVEAALARAGRDNITVAVLDVVPDGEGGNTSTAAAETLLVPAVGRGGDGPADDGQDGGPEIIFAPQATVTVQGQEGEAPEPSEDAGTRDLAAAVGRNAAVEGEIETTNGADVDVESGVDADPGVDDDSDLDVSDVESGVDVESHVDSELDVDAGPGGAVERSAPDATGEVPTVRRRRRSNLSPVKTGIAAFLLGILAAACYVGVTWWVNTQWFVDVNSQDQLSVFRGRPDGFLWIEPTEEVNTGESIEALTAEAQSQVRAQQTFESQDAAEAFIEDLEREVTGSDLDAAANSAVAEQLETVVSDIDSEGGSPSTVESTTTTGR